MSYGYNCNMTASSLPGRNDPGVMRNPSRIMIFADGWNRFPGRISRFSNSNWSWPFRNSGDDPAGANYSAWFRHLDNTDPRAGSLNMLFVTGHVESKVFEEVADTYGLWLHE